MRGNRRVPSLKLNFIMNTILTVSSILFPLITFPYVSRILLPEGTGKVAFATSLISYFALFSQLGIPTYGIRACAKVRDDKTELTRTAQELFIINLVMSAIVYAVLFVAVIFIPRLRAEQELYLVISSTILFNAIGMEWLYKALEQYTYITIRSMVFKIVALIGMFLLIHRQSDYVLYGGLTIFAASASNILNFLHARRYISMRPIGGYHFSRHFRAVVIFFAMTCAVTIYTHIDSAMLGIMLDDTAVGYYDAALKVRSALLGVVTSLGVVLMPRTSYYIQHGQREEFMRVSIKAMQFVFLLATPITVFFVMFAKPCIYLLSGEAYYGAILPMQFILPTILLVGITNILGLQMLVPLGQEMVVLYSEIAGAITDLVLNMILIPKLGPSGAALGTLMAETVVFVVQYVGIHKEAYKTLRSIHYGKITVAILLATASSHWILMRNWRNILILLVGASLFFGIFILTMSLMKEPLIIEVWKQMIHLMKQQNDRQKTVFGRR